jgi:NTP pyrophosphatase (non-canonical NTP hydrolase)
MEERLVKICDHFGVDNQILKLAEEAGELRQAAFEFGQGECSEEDLVGEMADVAILIQQVAEAKGICGKVQDMIDFKVARTEERIKSGYYDKGEAGK